MIVEGHTPCWLKGDIFASQHPIDHAIAKRLCLGDGEGTPMCPAMSTCLQELPERESLFDGTQAGIRFRNGAIVSDWRRAGKRVKS